MATSAHQLTSVGIRLALQEQLSDPMLQQINLGAFGVSRWGGERRHLGNIALDSLGKLDLDLRSGFTHWLPDLDAEFSKRLGAVPSVLGRPAMNSLGSESLDFIVCLPIMKGRDLTLHLAHLLFQVAHLLRELSRFRPWQERHW